MAASAETQRNAAYGTSHRPYLFRFRFRLKQIMYSLSRHLYT